MDLPASPIRSTEVPRELPHSQLSKPLSLGSMLQSNSSASSSHTASAPSSHPQDTPALRPPDQRQGPLGLLDLCPDVLRHIVENLTHMNDLAALALTHSFLYEYAIPQIYSRFDIVWPETIAQNESRAGVDALTFGLSTLVMSRDTFVKQSICEDCSQVKESSLNLSRRKVKRRGNNYAQFTKKFSLGNGPELWIKDYYTDTEAGKMLGTLSALALAKMYNLEDMIWDMPTGIVPEVWHALASLDEHEHDCKLQKVWVRWHNSSPLIDGKHQARPVAHELHEFWTPIGKSASTDPPKCIKRARISRPTFSILPRISSLNVLDIDECSYLDEMATCISESREGLRELRVGIAEHAVADEWAVPYHDLEIGLTQFPKKSTDHIGRLEKRLGGVLGILLGHVFDLDKNRHLCEQETGQDQKTEKQQSVITSDTAKDAPSPSTSESLPADEFPEAIQSDDTKTTTQRLVVGSKLKLGLLALERVSLSIPVLAGGLDWTCLTDLTLLDCQFTPNLWQHLRRHFTPKTDKMSNRDPDLRDGYRLKLKKLHTNVVNSQLLVFLKETLEPNTLEVLFLQQSEYHISTVSPEAIIKCVKKHRDSLQKLLIDSSERSRNPLAAALLPSAYHTWLMYRNILHFLTSGKLPKLRELGVAILHKDWHYLLQRLPQVPQIRALHLSHVVKLPSGPIVGEEVKELANQVLDVVTLRPETELCYFAIGSQCYEIHESRIKRGMVYLDPSDHGIVEDSHGDEDDEEGDEDEDEDEEAEEEEDEDDQDGASDDSDESDHSLDASDDELEETDSCIKLELREICFYERVALFTARHGRL